MVRLFCELIKKILIFCSLLLLPFQEIYATEISLIRDIESEQFIANLVKPIFNAAKIDYDEFDVYIVNRKDLNAFVSNSSSVFVHLGLITFGDNSDELNGVLAHEIGHIANKHWIKMSIADDDKTIIGRTAGYILAASTAITGIPLFVGLYIAGAQAYINAIERFSYSRNYEREADIAAVNFLKKTKRNSDGLFNTMNYLHSLYSVGGAKSNTRVIIPYLQTHPLTESRLEFFKTRRVDGDIGGGEQIEYQFCRVKAKLCAFYGCHFDIYKCLISNDKKDFVRKYFQIHQLWRQKKISLAIKSAQELLTKHPEDVMLLETIANINYENQKSEIAIDYYRKISKIIPNNLSVKLFFAQILIYSEKINNLNDAIIILRNIRLKKRDPNISQLLEYAYNKINETTLSKLFRAEKFYYEERCDEVDRILTDNNIVLNFEKCKKISLKKNNTKEFSDCKLIVNVFEDLKNWCSKN
jgi:predicted Zn-dependent protease